MPTPHLTPKKLIGERFGRDTFHGMRVALVGYCPPPTVLNQYAPQVSADQYFIHLAPQSVHRCQFRNVQFLSLSHVYGGPVSASTVEELAYYGFEYVLAYGLAGGLGTQELQMGDVYLVADAFVADGTTPHYSDAPMLTCDMELAATTLAIARTSTLHNIKQVRAFTGDAIYQEHDAMLATARAQGCDIINLDSSHLFAAATKNNEQRHLKTIECGVISDVVTADEQAWDSTLATMLAHAPATAFNPMQRVGDIVRFYIEQLAPVLA